MKGYYRLNGGIVAALLSLGAEWNGVSASFNLNVGDILVANYYNEIYPGTVVKIDGFTRATQILRDTFGTPTDLVQAPSGHLYVSDLGGAIQRSDLTKSSDFAC